MFTEEQMKEIKKLGLIRYEYYIKDGTTMYYGQNDHKVQSTPTREPMNIAPNSSATSLKYTIIIHQQDQTDFPTFCRQAAEAGTEKWIVDTEKMLCTYYDQQGEELIAEPIPQATYD